MDPLLFLGSLIAILALAGIARWLGLGRAPRLASEAEARFAANEAVDGFEPVHVSLDRHGKGALLEDKTGRVLLLKPHGNFFAGRLLTEAARSERRTDQGQACLRIDSGEKRYGTVSLDVDDPDHWVAAINRLRSANHA
jgi:hypothetical protein